MKPDDQLRPVGLGWRAAGLAGLIAALGLVPGSSRADSDAAGQFLPVYAPQHARTKAPPGPVPAPAQTTPAVPAITFQVPVPVPDAPPETPEQPVPAAATPPPAPLAPPPPAPTPPPAPAPTPAPPPAPQPLIDPERVPAPSPLRISVTEVHPPAGSRAAASPAINRGLDGTVRLAWSELAGEPGRADIRYALFDAAGGVWRPAVTVGSAAWGPVFADPAGGSPALAACANGCVAIAWTTVDKGRRRAVISLSGDQGATWSAAVPLGQDGDSAGSTAYPTLAALAGNRLAAAWIERPPGGGLDKAAELHALTWSADPAAAPSPSLAAGTEHIVTAAADPGSRPELTPLLDGGALLSYRGRTDSGICDPCVARLNSRGWNTGHPINEDDWQPVAGTADSLVDGPSVSADGGRAAAAWYSGSGRERRLFVSSSPDAGDSFLIPLEANSSPAQTGRPAIVLLHDNAACVCWWARTGGLRLRRLTPDFTLNTPVVIDGRDAPWQGLAGAPSAAILADYDGGGSPARLLIAIAGPGATGLRTLLVTVPEPALLAAANTDCHCAPTPEELAGYPVTGTVAGTSPDHGEIMLDHGEFPGLLDAGTHAFKAGADAIASVHPGTMVLARIAPAGGSWRIFDVRVLGAPAS